LSISVFDVRKAAELAEAARGLLELDAGEGIGIGAVRADAEAIEKRLADQMRRLAQHGADADIDAGLAEEHGSKLRMRIRDVQDARIAEFVDVVDAGAVGAARKARQAGRERGDSG
jgi:hypothetical protein